MVNWCNFWILMGFERYTVLSSGTPRRIEFRNVRRKNQENMLYKCYTSQFLYCKSCTMAEKYTCDYMYIINYNINWSNTMKPYDQLLFFETKHPQGIQILKLPWSLSPETSSSAPPRSSSAPMGRPLHL